MKDKVTVVRNAAMIISASMALDAGKFAKILVEQLNDVYDEGHSEMKRRAMEILETHNKAIP